MTQAPAGWKFDRASNGDSITISGPGCICCIVVAYPSDPRVIPESVLYALVSDLLAAAPHTAAPAADRAVSELKLDELIVKHGLMDEAWPSQRKLEAFALDALARGTDAPSEPGRLIPDEPWMANWIPQHRKLIRDFARKAVRAALATPPAAATPLDPIGPESLTPEALRNALMNNTLNTDQRSKLYEMPAAATSTPCASGEGEPPAGKCARADAGIIECLCEPSDQARCAEFRPYSALAATRAPTLCDECGATHAPGQNTLCTDSRTPTAGNTEDARSMGEEVFRDRGFVALRDDDGRHDGEEMVSEEDEPHLTALVEGWSWVLVDRVYYRAALTQAASTGGAAS